jgi:hypothetical protein
LLKGDHCIALQNKNKKEEGFSHGMGLCSVDRQQASSLLTDGCRAPMPSSGMLARSYLRGQAEQVLVQLEKSTSPSSTRCRRHSLFSLFLPRRHW